MLNQKEIFKLLDEALREYITLYEIEDQEYLIAEGKILAYLNCLKDDTLKLRKYSKLTISKAKKFIDYLSDKL